MVTKEQLLARISELERKLDECAIQVSSAFHAVEEMATFTRINAGLRIVMNVMGDGRASVLVLGAKIERDEAARIAAVFARTLEKVSQENVPLRKSSDSPAEGAGPGERTRE